MTLPKHAVNTSLYAPLRHPWLRRVLEESYGPSSPTCQEPRKANSQGLTERTDGAF